MGVVTVAEVLGMPAVRQSDPKVLAAQAHVDRQVRWVHSAELADIAPLLRGGDLLLSTGIALPETADDLRAFAHSLGASSAAGLLIELGRRWDRIPAPLIEACEEVGLPLVSLGREVKFAAITQSVGERIVDEQLAELKEAQRVHDTFTELSIAEAGPLDILQAVQRMSGAAVALESDEHRVIDYLPGPQDVGPFLANWVVRSRATRIEGRTGWDERNGWLITRLGKRSRGWGRLVLESPEPPTQRLVAMAERAAAALALHRLHDRHRSTAVRRLHHELILGLLNDPADTDVRRRCELAGFELARRQLVGLTVRTRIEPRGHGVEINEPSRENVITRIVSAADGLKAQALVCEMDQDIRILLFVRHQRKLRSCRG